MQYSQVILLTLLAAAEAGNVCVGGTYKASKVDRQKVITFAAGSPCEDGKTQTHDGTSIGSFCNHLPQGFQICGKDANLVSLDHGPEAPIGGGCRIGLEIDGVTYEGETDKYNPDDGNKNGPCDASCGLTGIDGFLQFVGVPMC